MDMGGRKMIAFIQFLVFVLAFFGGKKSAMLVITAANCIIPDEIPFLDEIMYVSMTIKAWIDD